jgi:hypothetical protein
MLSILESEKVLYEKERSDSEGREGLTRAAYSTHRKNVSPMRKEVFRHEDSEILLKAMLKSRGLLAES